MLTIRTLGNFDVLLDGVSLLEGTDLKRGLLLTYLWEQHTPQPRQELAQLLWPWVDENTALVNLRSLLFRLRREGLANYLDAGRSAVALVNREEIHYDVALLRSLTVNVERASLSDLITIADLYKGEFLQTTILDEYPRLQEWAKTVRSEMAIRVVHALSTLVAQAISLGHGDMVLSYAELLVSLTPNEDESQALYMQALAVAGRIGDAQAHFKQYQRRLKEEFQVNQIGERLRKVVEQLQNQQPIAASPLLPQTGEATVTKEEGEKQERKKEEESSETSRFPHIEYPIVGREGETHWLLSGLQSGNRLMTVVGIGGTGKTFLIRSLYEQLQARFDHAIYYVDLRGAVAPPDKAAEDILLLAISTALNLPQQPHKPLFAQIVRLLQQSQSCLILDNFETVQTAAPLVLELLKATSNLVILVTSRERLNLSSESVLYMRGLSQQRGAASSQGVESEQAKQEKSSSVTESPAVRYFVQCAQRHSTSYVIGEEERFWIAEICREVDALPLAIELAALQLPFLTLAELAERVGTDQSVLAGDVGDLPGDHYSVWAVLDSMWQTLNDDERRVLAELSVFVGSFHREAMVAVVPAAQSTYFGLLNTSLLRTEDPGWFSLHPLVKQYAAKRLVSEAALRERHTCYFLKMLEVYDRQRKDLPNRHTLPAQIVRSQADILTAWLWAVATSNWDLLDRTLSGFAEHLTVTQQFDE